MSRLGKISLVLLALSVCATTGILNHLHRLEKEFLDPREIYQVVSSQFQSFQNANFVQAYDHATNATQVRFNLNEFEFTARTQYPQITSACRVEFGSMQLIRSGAQLRVYFVEKNGQATACLYSLVSEQGRWKIDTVETLREWPKGSRLTGLRL